MTDYAQELTVRPPFMHIKIESYATLSTEKANLPGVVQLIDKLEEIRILLTETLDSNNTKGDCLRYCSHFKINFHYFQVLKLWNLPEDNNHKLHNQYLKHSDSETHRELII